MSQEVSWQSEENTLREFKQEAVQLGLLMCQQDRSHMIWGFILFEGYAITETDAEAVIRLVATDSPRASSIGSGTKRAIWLSDSSTGSNNFVASRPATTNSLTASTLSCIWLSPTSGYCEQALVSAFGTFNLCHYLLFTVVKTSLGFFHHR